MSGSAITLIILGVLVCIAIITYFVNKCKGDDFSGGKDIHYEERMKEAEKALVRSVADKVVNFIVQHMHRGDIRYRATCKFGDISIGEFYHKVEDGNYNIDVGEGQSFPKLIISAKLGKFSIHYQGEKSVYINGFEEDVDDGVFLYNILLEVLKTIEYVPCENYLLETYLKNLDPVGGSWVQAGETVFMERVIARRRCIAWYVHDLNDWDNYKVLKELVWDTERGRHAPVLTRDEVKGLLESDLKLCEDPRKTHWKHFIKIDAEKKRKHDADVEAFVNDILSKKVEHDSEMINNGLQPLAPIVDVLSFSNFCEAISTRYLYKDWEITNKLLLKVKRL